MNAPTETDVLTACGFRLLARAETEHPTYRPGLIAAALLAFTDAEHGHPATAADIDHAIRGGGGRGDNPDR